MLGHCRSFSGKFLTEFTSRHGGMKFLEVCVPGYFEFYGDIAVAEEDNMTPNTACIAFKLDQMNESQRSNQALQWKPDQSVLPFFLPRKLLPSN